MAVTGSLQLSHGLGLCRSQDRDKRFKVAPLSLFERGRLPSRNAPSSPPHSSLLQQDHCSVHVSDGVYRPIRPVRNKAFRCHAMLPGQGLEVPGMKASLVALTRSYSFLKDTPIVLSLAPAIGMMVFAIWGLGPLLRQSRNMLLQKNDSNWNKSATYYVMTSYVQPILLWLSAVLVCRTLDPIILPTEASQVVKLRLLNFVRSLSTVLAFAYCLSSLIQQAQKFFMESNDPVDARNMGFQFARRAVYSAVWVAAASLFMELLGFSTQKWLTAGGLGTVLLTLAGREIFTNFLSSVMIHATRPFVVNEWIQTKIEGYEVSGTVEHVGWWSPTIIRGEDREAVHIPNHKFTVNVVRNLTQKTHWRIKTHLVISHRDAVKINSIIADMRKVLAKNPQVEQQKLHRRVFLDNINPENQGLMILVSCFIKTSHHEEYLCVKEAILLDLLRVISHHRARLATPIRTMQKIYSDSELENIPLTDTIYNRGGPVANRPLQLIEPSYKINGEENAKPQTRPGRFTGEQDSKTSSRSTPETKGVISKSESKVKDSPKSETKVESNVGDAQNSNINEVATASAPTSTPKSSPASVLSNANSAENSASDNSARNKKIADNQNSNINEVATASAPTSTPKSSPVSVLSNANSAENSASDNSARNKKIADNQQSLGGSPAHTKDDGKSSKPSEASVSNAGSLQAAASRGKQEAERKPISKPSVSGTALEENIVLGVALDGSKRTLPIEEGMVSSPSPAEPKEVSAALKNGTRPQSSENEKKGQTHASSTSGDQ